MKPGNSKGPGATFELGSVRRFVGPAAAAVVVLLQVLLSLAELRRPVFVLVSILAASLLLLLAAWYLVNKQVVLAILCFGGFVLVGILSLVGMPTEQTELVRAGGVEPPDPTVAQSPDPTATPSAPILDREAALRYAIENMRKLGFEPFPGEEVEPKTGLWAVVGGPFGQETAYDWRVFFFVGERYVGVDARSIPESSATPPTIAFTNDSFTVTVQYMLYRPDDPFCCPSGGDELVRYYWDGDKLEALDPIPSGRRPEPPVAESQGLSPQREVENVAKTFYGAWENYNRSAALAVGTKRAVNLMFDWSPPGRGGERLDYCLLNAAFGAGVYQCPFVNRRYGFIPVSFVVRPYPDGFRVAEVIFHAD